MPSKKSNPEKNAWYLYRSALKTIDNQREQLANLEKKYLQYRDENKQLRKELNKMQLQVMSDYDDNYEEELFEDYTDEQIYSEIAEYFSNSDVNENSNWDDDDYYIYDDLIDEFFVANVADLEYDYV